MRTEDMRNDITKVEDTSNVNEESMSVTIPNDF
jgi:hypothetical protein